MNTSRLFWIFFYVLIVTIVSFFMFDSLAMAIVFGFGVGGIFGWIFSSKKGE